MKKTNTNKPEKSSIELAREAEIKRLDTACKLGTRWKGELLMDGDPELLNLTSEIYTHDSQIADSLVTRMVRTGFEHAIKLKAGALGKHPPLPVTARGRAEMIGYLHGIICGLDHLKDEAQLEQQIRVGVPFDGTGNTATEQRQPDRDDGKNAVGPDKTGDDEEHVPTQRHETAKGRRARK